MDAGRGRAVVQAREEMGRAREEAGRAMQWAGAGEVDDGDGGVGAGSGKKRGAGSSSYAGHPEKVGSSRGRAGAVAGDAEEREGDA